MLESGSSISHQRPPAQSQYSEAGQFTYPHCPGCSAHDVGGVHVPCVTDPSGKTHASLEEQRPQLINEPPGPTGQSPHAAAGHPAPGSAGGMLESSAFPESLDVDPESGAGGSEAGTPSVCASMSPVRWPPPSPLTPLSPGGVDPCSLPAPPSPSGVDSWSLPAPHAAMAATRAASPAPTKIRRRLLALRGSFILASSVRCCSLARSCRTSGSLRYFSAVAGE